MSYAINWKGPCEPVSTDGRHASMALQMNSLSSELSNSLGRQRLLFRPATRCSIQSMRARQLGLIHRGQTLSEIKYLHLVCRLGHITLTVCAYRRLARSIGFAW